MDLIGNIALGFETALTVQNLFYALVGCLLGTLIGVLPGLGPLATISMLLPFTYGLEPLPALIMCQSARKTDPGSASNIDPLLVRDGERPTGWSWSGLRSPVGRVGEAVRL